MPKGTVKRTKVCKNFRPLYQTKQERQAPGKTPREGWYRLCWQPRYGWIAGTAATVLAFYR